jgi:hypothetical protein
MSVPSAINKAGPYACNGALTEFAFPYKFFQEEDLVVILTDSDGAETTLTITTHYTVSATNNDFSSGGTVTTVDAYSSDYTITILRSLSPTQESDYRDADALPAETLEDDLDKGAMVDQQLTEQYGRSLKIPASDDEVSLELPPISTRPNTILGFDADGVPMAVAGTTSVTVSAFAATVLDDADAAAARTTLGAEKEHTVSTEAASGGSDGDRWDVREA